MRPHVPFLSHTLFQAFALYLPTHTTAATVPPSLVPAASAAMTFVSEIFLSPPPFPPSIPLFRARRQTYFQETPTCNTFMACESRFDGFCPCPPGLWLAPAWGVLMLDMFVSPGDAVKYSVVPGVLGVCAGMQRESGFSRVRCTCSRGYAVLSVVGCMHQPAHTAAISLLAPTRTCAHTEHVCVGVHSRTCVVT